MDIKPAKSLLKDNLNLSNTNVIKVQSTETETTQPHSKSPLDYIAEAFWQDFIDGNRIDSGATYEAELKLCQLDGSVDSLKRIDLFLEKVQQLNNKRPDLFMAETANHNLVLFIAFYMGRVLSNALQTSGTWVGKAELMRFYPQLNIHPNNPFHYMAFSYNSGFNDDTHNNNQLFFALEPIAFKLFGDRLKMPPVIGNSIRTNLYDAVKIRLFGCETSISEQIKEEFAEQNFAEAKPNKTSLEVLKESSYQVAPLQSVNQTSWNDKIEIKNSDKSNELNTNFLKKDEFKALKNELKTVEVTQENVDVKYSLMYRQAIMILDGSRPEPNLNKDVDKATGLLLSAAEAGHTSAMLRLAIEYFSGEGVNHNVQQGFDWVQRAANKADARAQRQLSRLYYKGLGCIQNIDMGRQWLELAAENGHQESKALLQELQSTKILIAENKEGEKTDKRYLIIVVGAVLISIVIALLF